VVSETFGSAHRPHLTHGPTGGDPALGRSVPEEIPAEMLTLLIVFAVIFLAELPDKTAVATLVLASRFRPWPVFAGVALAFTLHVVLAVAAGQALSLLPQRLVEVIVGVLFAVGAVLLLRPHDDDETDASTETAAAPSGRQGFVTAFTVVLFAEFGDLTQIGTANLAAKYHDPIVVGLGAVLALWAVAGVAIVGGRGLLKVVPVRMITRAAAALLAVLAVVTLVGAATG
jgi:Ca2+/H+ antiporter, TMEM165/GDT1 family